MAQPYVRDLGFSTDDFAAIDREVRSVMANDAEFPAKMRRANKFKRPSAALQRIMAELVAADPELCELNWYFEVFHSVEAVGKHNDRNIFPHLSERCERGLIVPIDWQGLVPTTLFYDLFIDEKVNWNGRGFSTLEKQPVEFDSSALDRSVELVWRKNSLVVFDSRQIHEAGIFARAQGDFKLSVNGLGYSKYPVVV